MAAVIGGAAVLLALIGGGVHLAVGDDGGKEPAAGGASPGPSDTSASDPAGEPTAEPEPTDDPLDEYDGSGESGEPGDSEAPAGPPPADEDDFRGQWQSDEGGQTLTVGATVDSGQMKGRNAVSWVDPGGAGLCIGFGENQSRGFRVAVKCGQGDDEEYLGGTATKSSGGESVSLRWDEGGTDTLDWIG